jgi:hypothetical protein
MSDTAFVPGQMRVVEPEQGEESETASRRGLLLVAAAAVLAVVGIVAWLLFFSGGSEPTADTTAAAAPAPATQPSVVAPSPSPVAANPNASSRSKHAFRDPFRALIVPAAPDAGTVEAAAAGAGAAPGSTTAGSTTTTTGATTTGTTTPTGSTAHTLKVVSVASNNTAITVKVDGKSYKNLKAGEVFAKFFKVIGIGGQVNVIQFGDEKFNISGTKAVTLAS